jgi:hypothetical protein
MFDDNFIISYVRTDNSHNYIVLYGTRDDFRARQRSVNLQGDKYPGLKFTSYKEITRHPSKINGIHRFYGTSKL